jgi:uncharacterized protein
LRGTLVGPDGQTTVAVVTFTPAGLRDRREVVALIRRGLAESCHAPPAQQHFAGPVIDGLSVDEASNDSLNRFAVPSALVVFLVCWSWLRWLPGALLVTGVSLYCEAATLALIYWCGGEMTALLIVLPPLMQVVTASGGIHLINYYLIAAKDYDPETAAWGAVRIGWLPCSLSALTTAIGLASLCVSQLVPVRMFGAYGAAGVLMTFAAVTTFIPGALSIWKPKGIRRAASVNLETGVFEGTNRFWTWLSRQVARHHTAIVVASVVAMVSLGWGIRELRTSVHVRTLFADDSRIVSDYAWIEEHVGALVPLEVVVEFGPHCALPQADRYRLVSQIQRELQTIEHVQGTVSCANLMPDLSDIQEPDPAELKRMLEAILKEARPYFAAHHYLHESDTREQWRVTAYTSALRNQPKIGPGQRRLSTSGGCIAARDRRNAAGASNPTRPHARPLRKFPLGLRHDLRHYDDRAGGRLDSCDLDGSQRLSNRCAVRAARVAALAVGHWLGDDGQRGAGDCRR